MKVKWRGINDYKFWFLLRGNNEIFLYIPAVDILEILALAELAFAAAAVEDTYAVADVGVGLHNWYKLNKNTNGLVQVTNALML